MSLVRAFYDELANVDYHASSMKTYGGNQWLLLWSWLSWLLAWESVSTTVTTVVAWVVWASRWTLESLSAVSNVLVVVALAVVRCAWVWHGRDNCGRGQSRGEDRKLHDGCVRGRVMRG